MVGSVSAHDGLLLVAEVTHVWNDDGPDVVVAALCFVQLCTVRGVSAGM